MFGNCLNLEMYEVEDGNPNFCSIEGIVYSSDKKKFYLYQIIMHVKNLLCLNM